FLSSRATVSSQMRLPPRLASFPYTTRFRSQGSRRQGRAEDVPRGQGRTPGRRLAGAAGLEGDRPVHRAVLGAHQGLQGTARAPYRGRGVGDVSASPRTLRRGPARGDGRADDAIKESPEEGAQRSQGGLSNPL